MITPFIADKVALHDAADLIARFGDDAKNQAAALARRSRSDGNVRRFCHWRQIERVISVLADEEVVGTIN